MSTLNHIIPAHLHILIVEDETRLRDLLLDLLPEMGFHAQAARSAEEAKRIMEDRAHDIVLLDLQLPGMHGMEFLESLRDRWPRTQVIIITGFGDFDAARQAIRLDVVDFLTKPCHLKDLELAIDRARRRLQPRNLPPKDDEPIRPTVIPPRGSTLKQIEREQILAALARNEGNRSATAAELGISRRTLYYRLRQYTRDGSFID